MPTDNSVLTNAESFRSPLLELLYSLAALTKLALTDSLIERRHDGIRLDEIDDIPSLLTTDVSRRYGIKFMQVIRDKENVRYLRVSAVGDLDVDTRAACGRSFKWFVEVLDNYHDICDRRLYGANVLEDYSIIESSVKNSEAIEVVWFFAALK